VRRAWGGGAGASACSECFPGAYIASTGQCLCCVWNRVFEHARMCVCVSVCCVIKLWVSVSLCGFESERVSWFEGKVCCSLPLTLDAWSRSAGATACATCVAGTYANSSGMGRGAVRDGLC
jgi:hypothetical protein